MFLIGYRKIRLCWQMSCWVLKRLFRTVQQHIYTASDHTQKMYSWTDLSRCSQNKLDSSTAMCLFWKGRQRNHPRSDTLRSSEKDLPRIRKHTFSESCIMTSFPGPPRHFCIGYSRLGHVMCVQHMAGIYNARIWRMYLFKVGTWWKPSQAPP